MKNLMFLLAVGSLLTACSGGSDTVSDASTGPTAPPTSEAPAPSVRDAFTSKLAAIVGTAPEDAEPVAIDGNETGTSENSEPASV